MYIQLMCFTVALSSLCLYLGNIYQIDRAEIGRKLSANAPVKLEQSFYEPLGEQTNDLMWFVQVSDLHVSSYYDKMDVIKDFERFCSVTVPTIDPTVILVTGDLTDGISEDRRESLEIEEEWMLYQHAIKTSKVAEKYPWLDLRGNHDNFDVSLENRTHNFFTKYSVQGKKNPVSYMHTRTHNGKKYSFIGVDATINPGVKRAFNFIGKISPELEEELQSMALEARQKSDYTIWFGHYPTSCLFGSSDLRDLVAPDVAYLCGHLHTLGGIIPHMYSIHSTGAVELELADWKVQKMYRIMAIDHGLMSFTDLHLNQWPAIVILNPKDASTIIPGKESLEVIQMSTHVRVLVFSTSPILYVRVRFSNQNKWHMCSRVKGPLFTVEWDPDMYHQGTHRISVWAKDQNGNQQVLHQTFSLDGTVVEFGLFSRFLILSKHVTILQLLLVMSIFIVLIPLVMVKHLPHVTQIFDRQKPCRMYLNIFRALATNKFVYNIIFLWTVYLPLGPWNAFYVVHDSLGVMFPWGLAVDGQFLPAWYSYMSCLVHTFLFHFPSVIALAKQIKSGKKAPLFIVLGFYAMFLTSVRWFHPKALGLLYEICGTMTPVVFVSVVIVALCSYNISGIRPLDRKRGTTSNN